MCSGNPLNAEITGPFYKYLSKQTVLQHHHSHSFARQTTLVCLSCISKQKAADSELTGANGLVCFRVQLKTDSSRPAAAGSETEGVNTADNSDFYCEGAAGSPD